VRTLPSFDARRVMVRSGSGFLSLRDPDKQIVRSTRRHSRQKALRM